MAIITSHLYPWHNDMKSTAKNTIISSIGCIILATGIALGEFHTFSNSSGDSIKAELLSHKDGKVTLKREDGETFEIEPDIFSTADQEYIAKWISETPADLDYKFRITGSKKKIASTKKRAKWVYVISATNESQDTLKDIVFEYRVVYVPSSNATAPRFHKGSETLTQELDFNKTFVVTTTSIRLSNKDKVDADIIGCLLRVRDPLGNIVHEWASSEAGMKGITWETADEKPNIPAPGTGVIK